MRGGRVGVWRFDLGGVILWGVVVVVLLFVGVVFVLLWKWLLKWFGIVLGFGVGVFMVLIVFELWEEGLDFVGFILFVLGVVVGVISYYIVDWILDVCVVKEKE